MPRNYQLKRRAERQNETRQRIIEATVQLHEMIGGAKTTISAIAEQAGVERLTVYRHFPDERTLFTGCTSHYLALNPPPDPNHWQTIASPTERLRIGLAESFIYHRRTEPMFTHAARDMEEFPVLREILAPFFAHWDRVRDILSSPWETSSSTNPQVRAIIGHAISFQTWQSLGREQKLNDVQMVDFWVDVVSCLSSDHASGIPNGLVPAS